MFLKYLCLNFYKRIIKMTKLESGRSMVEMLGVLAIIGVLSIGGIAGYKYAMDKNEANNYLNNFNLFSILLKSGAYDNDCSKELVDGFYCRGSNIFALGSFSNKNVCEKVFELLDYESIQDDLNELGHGSTFALSTKCMNTSNPCSVYDESTPTFQYTNRCMSGGSN